MHHILFIHSSVSGHLGCFHVLAIVNSAAMNIGVHVSFQIMFFSQYMPRVGCRVISSVQSLSRVQLFAIPWIAAHQASLFITISRRSLRLTSIESVMPSSHLILGRPLLLRPPIPPSIRVFSNESTLLMRWQKYWSFSFSNIPSKEIPGLIMVKTEGYITPFRGLI